MRETIRNPRIFFTGVGGQGTLTATRLLAQAALEAGIHALAGEVHGMAQRGGVVESTLLLGGWRSPRLDFGEADIILGFEPLESLRALPYLKTGGYVFSDSEFIPPLDVSLGQKECPPLESIIADIDKKATASWFIPCRKLGIKCGAAQAGNTALLGAICASGLLPFGVDALEKAIIGHLPAKIQKANLQAMSLGAEKMRALV